MLSFIRLSLPTNLARAFLLWLMVKVSKFDLIHQHCRRAKRSFFQSSANYKLNGTGKVAPEG